MMRRWRVLVLLSPGKYPDGATLCGRSPETYTQFRRRQPARRKEYIARGGPDRSDDGDRDRRELVLQLDGPVGRWLAYEFARRYAHDPRFSFDTCKIEVLGGYTSAIFLVMVAGLMIYQSLERLIAPSPIHYDQAIAIAILGLLVNLASAWLLKGGHHHHHDHAHHAGDHHGHMT